jgi:choline-sulfatase
MPKAKARGKKLPLILIPLALVAAAAAAVFLLSRKPDFSKLRGSADYNVILVTLDTVRADRLGCYGFANIETPALDGFAADGIKFEKCYSPTPLTLPAHTSIMTGTLPPFHGVRDNGGFVVPSAITTMAEVFKERGYDTAGFVAAYVLDGKWGLNQGFDTYFDRFDLGKFEKISLGSVQRPANEVMDEALAWLEKMKDRKFFAWIHLYDPHTPYEPPPPFDKQYASRPYLGEIAFTDSQLVRLRRFLEDNGLMNRSFLAFAGDHGESLGEHQESAHGFFVYQAAIHVPLIFTTPFQRFRGVSSPRVVSLADILPTICDMTGVPVPEGVQGRSLVPLFEDPNGGEDALAYSETFYPRFHYGWSELKAVQDGRFKLILAPVPELYDVVQDPAEEKNLVYLEKDAFRDLSARAEAFVRDAGRNAYEFDVRKVDEETREKLAALGYIGSFTDPTKLQGRSLGNPREKIGVFNALSKAREIGMSGRADEALRIIGEIVVTDPEIPDAYFTRGNILFKARRYGEAIAAFRKSLELKPDDDFAVINISNSYLVEGKFDEAERFVLDFLKQGFGDAQLYFVLGNMNFLRREYGRAVPYFEQCLARNPRSAASHNALAAIYINQGDLAKADAHIRDALNLDPTLTNAHYNLAQILEAQGRGKEAEEAYLREIERTPRHFKALFNLSRLYRALGEEDRELEYLRKAVDVDPAFPLSYFYIARILLDRGRDLEEAVTFVRKGLDLKPGKDDLPLGYFLLADLYNRLGDGARSAEYALKGRAAAASR